MPPDAPEMPCDGLSVVLAKLIDKTSKMAAPRVMRALRGIVGFNNSGLRKSMPERAKSVGKIEL